jgi:hypothetical protein
MREISYQFSDVPLLVRVGEELRRIALIEGECVISFTGNKRDGYEWDIHAVTLSGPIKGDPDATLVRDTELFRWVTASIVHSCIDEIPTAIEEGSRPDPSDLYKAARDDAAFFAQHFPEPVCVED